MKGKKNTNTPRTKLVFVLGRVYYQYPFIHLNEERQYGAKFFCLRKQHNGRDKALNHQPSDLKSSTSQPLHHRNLIMDMNVSKHDINTLSKHRCQPETEYFLCWLVICSSLRAVKLLFRCLVACCHGLLPKKNAAMDINTSNCLNFWL